VTFGPALILLGLLENAKAERGLSQVLLVYGRVPMFYYILHIYLIHVLAILVALAVHQPASWLRHGLFSCCPHLQRMVTACRLFT
jgi:uncharacterized membrane protein